ncbi:endonuclease/exonuclease/phosphatase family protein [Arthrobacter sp. SLBN-53]|uniref:endonuclease/exonuclease/phosphatase family protein n=1 Tax=Arthrobacter sp. SLBN-53 TaxID=2768412 RepID=UPI00114EFAD4|nr:endonuclease/exonuclease/phosphatase family protein [Arthrobacter sp. SLBN-53]TQK31907.1 endonuclease/exonuclease/phosphatase (EEP) superfamily protein YafD [Arthrobacter sp. SLBN-53]
MQPLRRAVAFCGALLLLIAMIGVGAHFVGLTSTLVAWAASFTPIAVLVAAGALLAAVVGGRRWMAAAAAVVLGIGVATQAPLYRDATDELVSGVSIQLMQANIRLGSADPKALRDAVEAQSADLLTVIELTDEAVANLAAAGLGRTLPYSCERPRTGGGGAGIYSRYPLRDCAQLDGFVLNNLRAVADIPDMGPSAVYALHPLPPYPEPAWKWVFELKRLRPIFQNERYPMLVGADFNSTYDHKQYRDLIANSARADAPPLVDVAENVGAGVVPTFPAGRLIPPVLAIDRILARGFEPISFRRFALPGSDHMGVASTLAVPQRNSQ